MSADRHRDYHFLGQRVAGWLAGCSSVLGPVLSQQDADHGTDAKAPSAPCCLPVPAGREGQLELGVRALSPQGCKQAMV